MRNPSEVTAGPRAGALSPFLLALVAGWLVGNVGAVADPMARSYGVSLAFVGVLAVAAVATHALMQVPAGRLVDRYGARAAGLAGLAILAGVDGLGAIAPEPALALPARLVVGVGTALAFVAGADLLRARHARAFAQGLYGGAAMSGAGLSLALLPQVADDIAWRVSWLSAAGLAAAGLVAVALVPGEAGRARASEPAHGAASILRDRRLYRLAALYTASYGSSLLVGNWVVTLLERDGYSSAAAGSAGALTLFAGIVSRPFGGWLGDRRPELTLPMIVAGVLIGAAGTAALTFHPPLAAGVVASAAVGIGAGLPFGPVFSGAQRLRPDRPAAAIGFVNFVANATAVAGVPLVGLTFSLPGHGRIGLLVVAALWASALAVLPRPSVFQPSNTVLQATPGLADAGDLPAGPSK